MGRVIQPYTLLLLNPSPEVHPTKKNHVREKNRREKGLIQWPEDGEEGARLTNQFLRVTDIR